MKIYVKIFGLYFYLYYFYSRKTIKRDIVLYNTKNINTFFSAALDPVMSIVRLIV